MTRKSLMVTCIMIAASYPISFALAEDPMPAKGLLAQQGPDLWRGSKLIGVNVYGPDNKKVGDISDVLMSHDGKATFAIIGVGGFLGIGQRTSRYRSIRSRSRRSRSILLSLSRRQAH